MVKLLTAGKHLGTVAQRLVSSTSIVKPNFQIAIKQWMWDISIRMLFSVKPTLQSQWYFFTWLWSTKITTATLGRLSCGWPIEALPVVSNYFRKSILSIYWLISIMWCKQNGGVHDYNIVDIVASPMISWKWLHHLKNDVIEYWFFCTIYIQVLQWYFRRGNSLGERDTTADGVYVKPWIRWIKNIWLKINQKYLI